MMTWVMLNPRANPEDLGFIPMFLSENDPRSAKEQIHGNYQHGGGWSKFDGFVLNDDKSISYPGDPPQYPYAMTLFRDELIFVYPSSWVLILQKDDSFEIARID